MTAYALRKGVSYCRIGESNVFLDIGTDRYFCLQRRLNAAFTDLSEQRHVNAGLIGALKSSGILEEAQSANLFACAARAPACLDDVRPQRRPSTFDLVRALGGRARWNWRTRKRSLSENIAYLERRRQDIPADQGNRRTPQDLARAYRGAAAFWSETGRCLPTAMALFEALVKAGHPARLVFGVHLTPFHAHCWVELGGRLVNDEPERVRLFTPIRIV